MKVIKQQIKGAKTLVVEMTPSTDPAVPLGFAEPVYILSVDTTADEHGEIVVRINCTIATAA